MADHSLRIYESILEMLSNDSNPTPLVRLTHVTGKLDARIYGKLEWYNPFGAVKDRVAAQLVKDAEERGILPSVKRLVEPTSGNTGLGLAMIANAKGYSLSTPLSLLIPEEKRAILRFLGADVIELEDTLCPAPGAPEGAIALAQEMSHEPGRHMLNQYENEANPLAHYRTTGPEIWRQTEGKVTHFFAALGTCGTITGTGRFLKEKNPDIQVVGIHPAEGHDIPGVRSIRQLQQTKLFRPKEYDRLIEVSDEEAYAMCLRLNREESLIAGPSSALALVGAVKALADSRDAVAVVMFPDNIFKYASSIMRHFPEMFPKRSSQASSQGTQREPWVEELIANSRNPRDTISVPEVAQLHAQHAVAIIDVREKFEFDAGHIVGAEHVQTTAIKDGHPGLPADKAAEVITVCASGNRSIPAMLMLRSLGYSNVRSMNGGTRAWIEQGLPVSK